MTTTITARTPQVPTAHDPAADPNRVSWRGWAALTVLMLPVLLVSVDNTALNFALPQIALDLQPSGAQQLWVIDVYPLVLAGLLVTMGTIGDRFGRRRILLIGATGFASVSALAAFAPDAGWLIAARAGLGIFGAMLMPSTLSLIRSIFTNRNQRRLAVAVWAATFSAGAAGGPILGGFLLEHLPWASVFLIAVPILVPLLAFAPLFVPESRDPHPGPIDLLSIALSTGTMVLIVYAITEISVTGITAPVVLMILVGASAGCFFVRRQLVSSHPSLDVRLFARGAFTGALLVNLLSITALVGFEYFIAQHLQLVVGMTPLESGFVLLPSLGATILAGLAVVPIARRLPAYVLSPPHSRCRSPVTSSSPSSAQLKVSHRSSRRRS